MKIKIEIRNQNIEIRNKFEIQTTKIQNCFFEFSNFCYSNLFRISCFGFRI